MLKKWKKKWNLKTQVENETETETETESFMIWFMAMLESSISDYLACKLAYLSAGRSRGIRSECKSRQKLEQMRSHAPTATRLLSELCVLQVKTKAN